MPWINLIKSMVFSISWRTKEFAGRSFSNDKQIGVIAQDVEKVFPELVNTDSDGYKSVNYSKLTPILIEAVKEQEASIKNLILRTKTLEEENKKIRLQNAKLIKTIAKNENKFARIEQAINILTKNKQIVRISNK